MAASSSSGPQWKYEVFINFRGEDTRKGFVSHLYRALRQKTVNTFIDAEELGKGDRLSELLTVIRESRLSIVVFSQDYASSTWCLKELVEILKCKDTKEQIVLPIFYEVDPSDVRKLKGSFAEAFAKHERHSKVDVKEAQSCMSALWRKFAEAFDQHDHDSNAEMEEVQSWRAALTTATSLSGWDSRNYKEDAKLIEEIVEDVFRKLRHISSTPCEDNGVVEMDSHIHEMHLRLHPDPPGVELDDVRVVGIWGMGGLGKTTIARAVYDKIASQFEACCFLENVKEGFMKHDELHMQTQLLSSISGNKVESSHIMQNGFQVMLKSLGHKKVLLVVDDVDELAQIEALLGKALLGKEHSFGGGSRIIITTRDAQLLSGADAIYGPKTLSDDGALELFRLYAFRTNQPTKDYDDLTLCAVKYAQGLPLALKVLGAFLDNKTVREWEDVLEKIRKIPQREIHDVLKTSFDGLDDTERDIFLDIACFFKGMQKEIAIEILDGCGLYPHPGIRVLIERALITVSWRGKLEMHDSLQEMGREIVRQQNIKEPGRRSRFINLELSNSDEVSINAEAFDSMTQLRLLRISHSYRKQHLIGRVAFGFPELRCLSWAGYPLKSLPSNFQFKNLVDLNMQYSRIERLWEGTQMLGKLKFINLRGCEYLEETPDFTKVPNLERLIFVGCSSLVEVHPSILTHTNLALLDLSWCHRLTILPSIRMQSLETLELSSSINNLMGLRYLKLKDCKELKSLPSVIRMRSLKTLDLSGCSSLEMFPEISLTTLDLFGCSSLKMFPKIFQVIAILSELNLSGSKLKELPSSINNLTGLGFLSLKDCKELKSLPSVIHMRSLKTLDLSGCSSLEMFPEIFEGMEKLKELNLSGSKLKELPSSINNLTGLGFLSLKDCKELKSLPSVIHMRSLKTLDLSGCSSLEMFPEIFEGMEKLEELNLSGSKLKELSSSINNLMGLRYLKLKDCKELKSLPSMFPEIFEGMEKLEELNLSGSKLKELVIHMRSLITLDLTGCSSIEMFPEILEVMGILSELNLSGSKLKEIFEPKRLQGTQESSKRHSYEISLSP
ncbi:unnamed protein product [Malus baccata var. baccata]